MRGPRARRLRARAHGSSARAPKLLSQRYACERWQEQAGERQQPFGAALRQQSELAGVVPGRSGAELLRTVPTWQPVAGDFVTDRNDRVVFRQVGELRPPRGGKPSAYEVEPRWQGERGEQRTAPRTDAAAERASLRAHAKHIEEGQPIEPAIVKEALQVCEELYAAARWDIPEQPFSDEAIKAAVMRLEPTSSTGYPLCLDYPTNGVLIDKLGVDGLVQMVKQRLQEYASGEVEEHPYRVFVKREPHKLSKAAEGRWRLIWSAPVVDLIIDDLTFGPSLRAEIDNWQYIPSKPGYSPLKGDAQTLLDMASRPGDPDWVEGDMKCWDWTVREEYHWYDYEWRRRRCNNPRAGSAHAFWEIMSMRVRQHARGAFMLSDGSVYERCIGLLPSGLKKTLSFNSFCQVFLKVCYSLHAAGAFDRQRHDIIAQGDDTVSKFTGLDIEDYRAWLALRGHELQETEEGPLASLSFCSHRWVRVHPGKFLGVPSLPPTHVFVPTGWDRHVWQLAHREVGGKDVYAERLFSLCIEYAWHERFFELHDALLSAGASHLVRSHEWFATQHLAM